MEAYSQKTGGFLELSSEQNKNRGSLKIFFGYLPEGGMKVAMLKAAHVAQDNHTDVVIGYISEDGCPEIVQLKKGLEVLPCMDLMLNGKARKEFDLDSAISRNPSLIIVENLAHSNENGCRHKKRYQDVRELLDAGIDVYTTLCVQNIESLNDMVVGITGKVCDERIPDFIFDGADQVEFVDAAPEQQDRTEERSAALRNIALRRFSDRTKHMEKQENTTKNRSYLTEEHILVCLSPSPTNSKIIRNAARMAHAFHGTFTAIYVETSDFASMDNMDKQRLRSNMHLARQLGAAIEIVYGDDIAFQIAEFARLTGVSKVVIGRSIKAKSGLFRKSALTEQLLVHAPSLNIYIIPDQESEISAYHKNKRIRDLTFSVPDIAKSIGILAAGSLVGYVFEWLGFVEANIITIYVLAVLIIAVVANHRVYSLISSIVSVLIFNFLFTDPKFTLLAYDKGYPVTFVIMFIAAFLTGTLAARLKNNAKQSAQAAFRIKVLFDTNQLLQQAQSNEEILTTAAHQLMRLLRKDIIIYPAENGKLGEPMIFSADGEDKSENDFCGKEKKVAEWVMKNNRHAGAATQTFSDAKCFYLAIRVNNLVHGVVGIAINQQPVDTFENSIMLSILGECALAMENRKNAIEKEKVAVLAKNAQLRANLLRAISHDLRTPLTSISGNASNLLYNGKSFDEETKQNLYQDIFDDSMWLINLVENLLSVTRLEEGRLNLHISAELVDEVVKEALRHVNRLKTEHRISVENQDDLMLAKMDARLIVQVIINLVDNAIKYTPKGSEIIIKTERQKKWAVISVIDNGPGIPAENQSQVFEMFYSGANRIADSRRSLGLGLSLCKSIVNAHGGTINVSDNIPHGAVFTFTLPIEEVCLNEQTVDSGS